MRIGSGHDDYGKLRRMCGDWLPYASFGIQFLLFVGLAWYTVETWKIRRTAQEQVETSQKPCLTLSAAERQVEDAVLGMGGTDSAQILYAPEGRLHIINVGLGPAFNVSYSLIPEDPNASIARPKGYLVHILLREFAPIPVARELISGNKWNFLVNYDSLTGRRYETRITIDDLVLTKVNHSTGKIGV
jgi:hypothetical protein